MNEEFEKWATSVKMNLMRSEFKPEHDYINDITRWAFRTWSARQPEIDALIADISTVKEQNLILVNTEFSHEREIEKLEAENERLRKNAERYLWLRFADDEQLAKVRAFGTHDEAGVSWLPEGEAFDKAIDAAMKETK